MSINGVAWETGLSSQHEYSTEDQRDARNNTREKQSLQEGRPQAGASAKNNGQSWMDRMGKELKAALLATSYALTSTNM